VNAVPIKPIPTFTLGTMSSVFAKAAGQKKSKEAIIKTAGKQN
jgi:hypothetical protein